MSNPLEILHKRAELACQEVRMINQTPPDDKMFDRIPKETQLLAAITRARIATANFEDYTHGS